MKATKIKMQSGKYDSNNLLEIDSVYITECKEEGFHKKEELDDYLASNPGTIKVNIYPYPDVIKAKSVYVEKYLKSTTNSTKDDNLLPLPRE